MLNPGTIGPGRLERRNQLAPGGGGQRITERARRAQQRLREEGGVHERLAIGREIQEVRRRRIDAAGNGGHRQVGIPPAQRPLRGPIVGQLQPRRDAREQAAERFEMRHGRAAGRAGGLLDRHPRLQRAGGQVVQNGIREAPDEGHPVRHDRRRPVEPGGASPPSVPSAAAPDGSGR